MIPINYRPILIERILEASYPSSTTLLVLCVMLHRTQYFHSIIPGNDKRSLCDYGSVFAVGYQGDIAF